MSFASGTKVTEEKSRQEIERMLAKIGATRFGVLTDYENKCATMGFTFKRIQVQMQIPLPSPDERRFKVTPSGRWSVNAEQQRLNFEAEVRRRWRCLALALKAKLVAVEDGITTFEREFLPYMVTATGQTIADRLEPVIKLAMETGGVIPAQLALPSGAN